MGEVRSDLLLDILNQVQERTAEFDRKLDETPGEMRVWSASSAALNARMPDNE